MREYHVPAVATVPPGATLLDAVDEHAEQRPEAPLYRVPAGDGWRDVSAHYFRAQSRALAKGLVAAGVAPGERVALMSRSRYEWSLTDYAIWFAGAVSVPVYETSSADQVAWVLGDSEATAVIVESERHAALVTGVRDRLPALRHVWVIDDGALDDLARGGEAVPDSDLAVRRGTLSDESLATIIYTSGTTGRPKGCELTHRNFLFGAATALRVVPELVEADCSVLLILPLAHVFAREIQVALMLAGRPMGHSPDPKRVPDDLASFRPTLLLAVPHVFEKTYNTARQRAADEGKARLFDRAVEVAVAYSKALDTGGPGLWLRLTHAFFDALVYRRIRAGLGGRVRFVVSGGAPLGVRLGHFFRGLGVTVLEGWGLTETFAAAAVNAPTAVRIGTVGRPIPGLALRVADDGELLVRGESVFRRYRGAPEETAAAFDDEGWFHTGDLGALDDDGYLTITGRRKEIIITSGGKNVVPAALEDRIRAHPLVDQCLVVGDARPYVACLITLDVEALAHWKARHGKPAEATVADLRQDAELRAELQMAIDEANAAVSRAESIRRFEILDAEFSQEGGQLTPSLKLRREVVVDQYEADIERLYA